MLPVVTKVGSKVAAAFAGKASAKLAAKTGSAVATKLGGLLDPMVAIGILLWDLWDYQHSIYIERPILREAIFNYLIEVKRVLLSHQDNSIMSAIHQIETGLLKSLEKLRRSENSRL